MQKIEKGINEYSGEDETQLICDRTRDVVYNGEELLMSTYECSSCKMTYTFEIIKHEFCPFCGAKYKNIYDVSI